MMSAGSSGSEVASLSVNLKGLAKRDRSTSQVMEEIRGKINIPGVKLNVESQDMIGGGMGGGKPVNITIKGDQLDVLGNIAVSVKKKINDIKGIREVEDSISEGRPELQVNVNRNLASNYGLRVSQIGSALETAIGGKTATRYEIGGEEYDVRVKLSDKDINTPEKVKKLLIPSPTGATVRLDRIADFSVNKGPKSITRENQQRYVTVSAALYQTDLDVAIDKIKEKVGGLTLPTGYEIEYGGQYQEMTQSFEDLGFAFLLAIVLVYMVMASQFESLVDPFVIIFTVPMALIGVLPALFITGYNISVVSIIGLVMLAGIVVNNAIVLVDYINTLRSRGKTMNEAILQAGPVRLRPILMTALTTILALLPIGLGIGEGAEIQAPMAIVVIGGLAVATLLTLYVVPVLYAIFERFSRKIL
jgi:HAE1 family hydrophobic/amphiphilic exporter-1